jgi:hypothetical protein
MVLLGAAAGAVCFYHREVDAGIGGASPGVLILRKIFKTLYLALYFAAKLLKIKKLIS